MNKTATPYHFRPFTRADLRITAGWLRTPEVIRWWGNPEREETLITQDLGEPLMQQWIVEHERRPFAYAQAYPVRAWPQPRLAHLPDGARVIDTFIGEPAMLGHGHAGRYLRLLAEMLLAEGASVVAIDPDLGNRRARRAFAHAGFVEEQAKQTGDGAAVLMLYREAANHLSPPDIEASH